MRTVLIAVLLLSVTLSGCIGSDDSENLEGVVLESPGWQIGDWWLYTFETPQFGEDTARLVVTEINHGEGQYMLGISSEREAQRHAVINHNPFLGRIIIDDLAVYENGEPQHVFNFPWNYGDTWEFDLLGEHWFAQTVGSIDGKAVVEADSDSGHSLLYHFGGDFGFIDLFEWRNQEGDLQFRMSLTDTGNDYSGDVWFIRATDLKDRYFEGPVDGELTDTFVDSGHPSGIDFNYYVFYIDAAFVQGGSGTLSIKDHAGNSVLSRQYTPGTQSQELATIPSRTDEYTLEVTLTGGQSSIHFMIAGGIENKWTL
ncbi:MAG: hypothetical protein QGI21_06395 [Candidatus Poseidoniaceae archaeon]|jgi:hypothetical protein|nr:hypothetical protein [Candidatus Poseidoniaceae archaeon]